MGGESTHPGAPFKANPKNSYQAQVELQVCRGWWMVVWPVCRDFPTSSQPTPANSRATLDAARGSRKLSVPMATRRAPTSRNWRAWAARLDATHADHGDRDPRGDGATWASATGRIAAPESPPVPPPSHARTSLGPGDEPAAGACEDRAAGASANARSVLTSESASAPPASAALAHSRHARAVGGQLDDQWLGRERPYARHDVLQLGGIGADVKAGMDVGARHVQLECPRSRRADSHARSNSVISSAVEPITLVIKGTGRRANSGRSCSK